MTSKRAHNRAAAFDAETARDLALIDSLLEGDTLVPAADEDLRQIVTELRVVAPRPSDEFARRLDGAVASGFGALAPRPAASAGGTRRRWLAMAGACGVLLIALATAVTLVPSRQGLSSEVVPNEQATPDVQSDAPATAGEVRKAPQVEDLRSTVRQRKQVRTAELELVAEPGELEERADEVIAVTDRYRGYVQESSVTGGDAERANATFQLRLPADRFADALRDLSKIAHVQARTQNVADVTGAYDRIGTALADARAQRSGLLKALANAQSQQQVQSVKLRLRGVNRRIERLTERKQRLDERIDYVRLGVTIAAASGDPDGSWSVGDALDDAWSILTAIAGGLIVAAAILAPLAAIALIGFLAWRRLTKRARERVIDAPPTSAH